MSYLYSCFIRPGSVELQLLVILPLHSKINFQTPAGSPQKVQDVLRYSVFAAVWLYFVMPGLCRFICSYFTVTNFWQRDFCGFFCQLFWFAGQANRSVMQEKSSIYPDLSDDRAESPTRLRNLPERAIRLTSFRNCISNGDPLKKYIAKRLAMRRFGSIVW